MGQGHDDRLKASLLYLAPLFARRSRGVKASGFRGISPGPSTEGGHRIGLAAPLGRGGGDLLPIPPDAHEPGQGGVEQSHRFSACAVDDPVFAGAVYAQRQRGKTGEWVPALIGSGDLPLSDSAVRGGHPRQRPGRGRAHHRKLPQPGRDRGRQSRQQQRDGTAPGPRAAQDPVERHQPACRRTRGYLHLPRQHRRHTTPGLRPRRSAPEIKAATSVPDANYTITDADSVVEELVNPDRGMSALDINPGQGDNKPAR